MDAFVHTEFADFPYWAQRPSQRQLHVSDLCISPAEFARHQRRTSERDLAGLVWQCRDRYVYAQRLLQPGADVTEMDRPSSDLDLAGLDGPWDRVCVTYRRHLFDPQIDLFEAQYNRELSRWNQFRQRCCFRQILDCPAYTRCILENAGLLGNPDDEHVTSLEAMFECLIANIHRRYKSHEPIEE